MTDKEKIFKFKGVVAKNIFKSDTFSVYAMNVDKVQYPDIKQNKYNNVGISGDLHDLIIGVEYEIEAVEQDTKFGVSYKILNIKRDLPTTAEETYSFLREILTERQADALVANYPDIITIVKEDRISEVDVSKLKGIGVKTLEKIKNKIVENFYLMDLVTEFGNILSLSILKKIYDKYSSVEKLKERLYREPYITLTKVSGIGFKKADAIILELQKENVIKFDYDVKTSPDRCLACMLYLLEENENNGNTKMSLPELRKQCLETVPECADHFVDVVKDKNIYYNKETMDVALRSTYECEKYIADTIIENVGNANNVWDCNIEEYRKVGEFDLSDEQIQILDLVCKNNIAILNGFAGAGKTYSTKGLINLLEDNDKTYELFAPTGRASKVMNENTDRAASTVHRGLGYIPPNGWTYNEDHPLSTDIVIVDECSMVDIWLFRRLLEAIDFNETKLLMIGDSAQLPSVSAGNILHDFMQSGIVPTVTLSKIFRYSSGGLMKVASDARCCMPFLTKDMKNKATTFGDNQDYMFVDLPSELIPKNAVALYQKLLQNGYSVEDIQVLTAKNVGDCGTIVLNNMIQKVANPNYGSEVNMKVGDTAYYVGDLVLETVNNYKAEIETSYDCGDEVPTAFVSNGEIGIIKKIDKTYVVIDFGGVRVKYYRSDMNMIKLGYSTNIFKAQGGGFRIVILCTPQSDIYMLNSNLIYTGLTRMKEKLYHLGTLQTVNMAVKKKANLSRATFMQELLKEI